MMSYSSQSTISVNPCSGAYHIHHRSASSNLWMAYFKYLPIDKNTSDMISPILDFTSKNNFANDPNYNQQILGMTNEQRQAERINE